MEYGLGRNLNNYKYGNFWVLILVVMEYGLGLGTAPMVAGISSVLILVVMEYGLGLSFPILVNGELMSLNPCCNGIWSRTVWQEPQRL